MRHLQTDLDWDLDGASTDRSRDLDRDLGEVYIVTIQQVREP